MTDLTWLVRPRWGVMGAYLVALALSRAGVVQAMDSTPILAAAAITMATNLAAPAVRGPADGTGLVVGLLIFDACLLSVVLFFAGGASNPLSALYLIPIALAAVTLPERWAWVLTALSVAAYGALFLAPSAEAHGAHGMDHSAHGMDHSAHGMDHGAHSAGATTAPTPAAGLFDLHLRGMWMAFTLTAVSVAYFVTRVSDALRTRDEQLQRARTRALRAERVASLASLAGSTAHELGTPLASITLAAGEMQRAIEKGAGLEALGEDVALVRDQAKRCREIIDTMITEAGDTVGEALVDVSAGALVEAALASLPADDRERVEVRLPESDGALHLPRKIVSQALYNLVRNGLDASPREAHVSLEAVQDQGSIRFVVQDAGTGMTPEELEAALEPFVTSKIGRGKGLGLFLTRSVASRLGGELQLTSTPGQGTRASFEISRNPVSEAQ